jgi:hypothetical protein
MSAAAFTHSEIAAKLVGGALAHIAGNVQGKMPIAPILTTELERATVGLPQGGQTLFYPLSRESGVYMDLSGSVATVWYINGDQDRALPAIDAALKSNSQGVKQLKDESTASPKERMRSYEVELGGGRLAHVVVEYAERGAPRERFLVRVSAQLRKR